MTWETRYATMWRRPDGQLWHATGKYDQFHTRDHALALIADYASNPRSTVIYGIEQVRWDPASDVIIGCGKVEEISQ